MMVQTMNSEDDTLCKALDDISLPEKPEEPSQSDCCGSGCNPCVFDIYEQELKIWKKECQMRLRARDSCQENVSPYYSMNCIFLKLNKFSLIFCF